MAPIGSQGLSAQVLSLSVEKTGSPNEGVHGFLPSSFAMKHGRMFQKSLEFLRPCSDDKTILVHPFGKGDALDRLQKIFRSLVIFRRVQNDRRISAPFEPIPGSILAPGTRFVSTPSAFHHTEYTPSSFTVVRPISEGLALETRLSWVVIQYSQVEFFLAHMRPSVNQSSCLRHLRIENPNKTRRGQLQYYGRSMFNMQRTVGHLSLVARGNL